jgi:hypothetical protein
MALAISVVMAVPRRLATLEVTTLSRESLLPRPWLPLLSLPLPPVAVLLVALTDTGPTSHALMTRERCKSCPCAGSREVGFARGKR